MIYIILFLQCCVTDPLFDPWIRDRFFPDPGSQTHIFESLVTIFWVKISSNFFLYLFKNKIILNFVKFEVTKKVEQQNFSSLIFLLQLLDPEWIKVNIRDKDP
jgi:hypothetical protein